MLQHPISTDCNSDGIPKESRDHFEETPPPPKKLHVKKNIYNAIPNHIPLSHPLTMHHLSSLIARNLLAFTLTPTSFIMRYFYLFVFLKIVIATDTANLMQRQCKDTTTIFLTVRICQALIVFGRLQPP